MRLILADGTIIENGRAGYYEGSLWLTLFGYTMQQAATIAFDPDKTAHITFQYGEMQDTYDGYTNCVNLSINIDGEISICMKRGA